VCVCVCFCHLGNFPNQQSLFYEEFPQLASGGEEKTPPPKRGDENREGQHGPGLDLKHQGTDICCSVYFGISQQHYRPMSSVFSRHLQYILPEILTVNR